MLLIIKQNKMENLHNTYLGLHYFRRMFIARSVLLMCFVQPNLRHTLPRHLLPASLGFRNSKNREEWILLVIVKGIDFPVTPRVAPRGPFSILALEGVDRGSQCSVDIRRCRGVWPFLCMEPRTIIVLFYIRTEFQSSIVAVARP
jgi:hypothetical protein